MDAMTALQQRLDVCCIFVVYDYVCVVYSCHSSCVPPCAAVGLLGSRCATSPVSAPMASLYWAQPGSHVAHTTVSVYQPGLDQHMCQGFACTTLGFALGLEGTGGGVVV
jgi:hypothetical protein